MAITLTSTARFQPYSFEEMLRPYQMLTDEYNKREAEISALDTKAEQMRQYAQQELDAAKLEGRQPYSFATQYMDYANSLDRAAEDLATKGLRGTNRKTIYDLTSQYQTNVVPIETAVNTLNKLSEEQRKLGPKYLFDNNYSSGNISIQDLIDNPNMGYRAVSRDELYQKGIDAAKAESVRNVINNPAVKDLANQYFKIVNTVGYDSAEAQAFMENMKTIPGLEQAFNSIRKSAGVESLDLNNQSIADSEILNGMFAGLNYKETIDYKKDEAYSMALQDYYRRLAEDRERQNKRDFELFKLGLQALGSTPRVTSRIMEGTDKNRPENEVNKILTGLRRTDAGGVSTANLDKLESEIINLRNRTSFDNIRLKDGTNLTYEQKEELRQIIREIKSNSFNASSTTRTLQTAGKGYDALGFNMQLSSLNRHPTELVQIARSLITDEQTIKEKESKLLEERTKVYSLGQQWSHLSDDPYEALSIANSLITNQHNHQNSNYTIDSKNTAELNTVRRNLYDQLNTITTGWGEGSGMFRIKKDGTEELVDRDDALKLVNDEMGTIMIRDSQDGVKFKYSIYGKTYTFKGPQLVAQIEDINTGVSNFLKDFSKDAIYGPNSENLKYIHDLDALNNVEFTSENSGKIEGTPYRYVIAASKDDPGNIYKCIIENGKIIAINTLRDELSGGSNRDAIVGDLINNALFSILPRTTEK